MVAMTFCDGFAAITPKCRHKLRDKECGEVSKLDFKCPENYAAFQPRFFITTVLDASSVGILCYDSTMDLQHWTMPKSG